MSLRLRQKIQTVSWAFGLMKSLHVVVGIILRQTGLMQNEVLIALRPPHVVQPGVWEFPGGKVEENETLENALIREFHEEIGIDVQRSEFFLKIEKSIVEKNMLLVLHVFRIHQFHGTPHGREGQEIRWVTIDSLNQYTFPAANAEIVSFLQKNH